MNIDSLRNPLQDIAKQLRPIARLPFIPLIKVANEEGIEVELRFYSSDKVREAQCDLRASRPRILVYRRSAANGVVDMTPDKEHLLTPRERFSVAHELGHYLAFKNFKALPVQKEVDRREYRKQEKCMNDFASSLLVPDWLSKRWLESVSNEKPVSLNRLKNWAANQCGVSGEVVAKALTRVESSIGFLKTAEAVRLANHKRLFVVFYSTYGGELQLPNLHSYIDDDAFINEIDGTSGVRWIERCNLGNVKCEKLNIAWQETKVPTYRRRREFELTVRLSGKGYWISIRSDRHSDASRKKEQVQLRLFD